jgi:multicomponent Na+:H+ antiporter subunit D
LRVLPPLPVAIPLLVAAFMVGGGPFIRRRAADSIAIATAAAVTGISAALLLQAAGNPIVYWFGGWTPRNGVALGIAFAIDQVGATLATLGGLLMTAALVFSWRYFDAVGTFFHALMLVFLAAVVGFCLSGDLFNLFVFFELFSVAAYALAGYRTEDPGSLQGALNFAVTNSVGAFLVLSGIALLYGRTGALNLAQIGRTLDAGPADRLVIVAFVLLLAGFFVKAAVVPFHFWLADAYAVAPTRSASCSPAWSASSGSTRRSGSTSPCSRACSEATPTACAGCCWARRCSLRCWVGSCASCSTTSPGCSRSPPSATSASPWPAPRCSSRPARAAPSSTW